MFHNYFIIALRKLIKQRDYALLNVLGLALSIACSILIFALIRHHTSFDKYHKNSERIMRIVMDVKTDRVMPFAGVPMPTSRTLKAECSIVEKAAMRSAQSDVLISISNGSGGTDKFQEAEKFAWVEPELLDILDLPLLRGDAKALQAPNTVLISDRLAHKYFGASDPLGKVLRINNESDLRVVGILRDLPKNTDYHHEILGSWATLHSLPKIREDLDAWDGARGENYCFALLAKGHKLGEMEPVMLKFRRDHPHPQGKDLFQYMAKSMIGLHFDTQYGSGMDEKFLWALGFIGLFLLITACVNFINMATAHALARVREIGVRKSLGSTRAQLFWQFLFETGLIVTVSLLVGFVLSFLALPYLNTWLKTELVFDKPLLASLAVFLSLLGVALTFLAGFYPGLLQARINPVTSMKGVIEAPREGVLPLRKVLVTTQFVISQVLIISAVVVSSQMRYAQNADWGFRPGAVVTLTLPDAKQQLSLQQQLAQIAGVKSVSLCYQPPASPSNNHTSVKFDHRPTAEQWFANDKPADDRYLETFGLQLVAGRNLQAGDTAREYIVNETFVKKLNLASSEDILNKTVTIGTIAAPVVGVIRDFHNFELSQAISPIAVSTRAANYFTCAVQLDAGNPAPVLAQIRKVWESRFPEHYYTQAFMDERMGVFFETETMILRLVRTFAGIAIFIGCLGLYGLAAFMVARKRKEIGIRKTLGASIPGILWLFGREYSRLIVIAFAVATPIAWWIMDAWLQDYVYRVSLGAGVFAISLLATFAVAAFTVGFQSLQAALQNPVLSLRNGD